MGWWPGAGVDGPKRAIKLRAKMAPSNILSRNIIQVSELHFCDAHRPRAEVQRLCVCVCF